MPFSISSIRTRTLSDTLSANKTANKTPATENALLERYADYNIDAQKLARGERGIVVLSPNGEEPILAKTEWYYTGSGNFENNNNNTHGKGLAGTAAQYQAEQARLAKMNAEARAVKVEVLFDAESPDEEKEGFLADRAPA